MPRLIDEHTPDDEDGNDWADRHTHPAGEQPSSAADSASTLEAELAKLFSEPPLDEQGYVLDWPNISGLRRAARGYRCQYCSIALEARRDLLHVHHCDRDKTNNEENNLLVLCAVCHSGLAGHAHLLDRIAKADLELIRALQGSVAPVNHQPPASTEPVVTPTVAQSAVAEDDWTKFEILVQRANSGSGSTREDVRRELSRLITNRHPLALKAQRALIASDKSQGKVKASSAYEKGEALFSPGPGESPFLRG